MNTKLLSKLFVLILLTSVTFISCSDNNDGPKIPILTDITGQWTYRSNHANVNGDESISQDLGKQIDNFITSYRKDTKGSTYSFSNDGTYVFSSEGNASVKGTYILKENSVFELNDQTHGIQTAIIQGSTPKTIYISQDLKDIVMKEFNIGGNRLLTASLIEAYQ